MLLTVTMKTTTITTTTTTTFSQEFKKINSEQQQYNEKYYGYIFFVWLLSLKDTASGLIGPLVICRRGVLNRARQRTDVDREFALLFMVFDENKSWYLEENIQSYYNSSEPLLRDAEFQKSNKMYGERAQVNATQA